MTTPAKINIVFMNLTMILNIMIVIDYNGSNGHVFFSYHNNGPNNVW